jgi:ribosome-associated translation inhibitor RaiA
VLFHGTPRSEAFEVAAKNWVERLGNVFDRIQHCNVRIDRPHQHDHTSQFQIRLEIGIPGEEIVVSHHGADADPYVALAEAFTTARRRLIDHVQIRRGQVKTHTT